MTESTQGVAGADRAAGAVALSVRDLSKAFGETRALSGATIDLPAGKAHVLLGENGAGKSTLAKIVAGVHARDGGEVLLDGRPVQFPSVHDARAAGIAVVFQELSLAPDLNVLDNVFLGSETVRSPFGVLPRRAERRRYEALQASIGIAIPADAVVADLSVAEKQMVEIVKAISGAPRVLILDEPTSALTSREKSLLFETVHRLKRNGVAILYVTHHLEEVFEIGDLVSTMRDGEIVDTRPVDTNLTREALIRSLAGKALPPTRTPPARRGDEVVVTVRDLHTATGCRGVDLEIRRGEIVGIYGVMGCGREELGRALVGITPVTAGEIRFQGRPIRPRHPADALRTGIGYLPMDRKARGILPTRSIRENLTCSHLDPYTRWSLLHPGRERDAATERLRELRVRYGHADHLITTLSGGNQQKVLVGRAIKRRPALVILEDPTAGIDIGAKADLYQTIYALAAEGTSFLLLSSDLAETIQICHRLHTMYAGRLVDEIEEPTPDTESRIVAAVLGNHDPDLHKPATGEAR